VSALDLGITIPHVWRSRGLRDEPGIVTFALEYPRYIHAEALTHRMFSRNSSSSRAIPVEKMAAKVARSTWLPPFAKNKRGMQAGAPLEGGQYAEAVKVWRSARDAAVGHALALAKLDAHKQFANRILEPFATISTVLTMTEDQWGHFAGLRDHEAAEPTFQALAREMRLAMEGAPVVDRAIHLPFIREGERPDELGDCTGLAMVVSAARCARVSYDNHLGEPSSYTEDVALFQRLWSPQPPHASPLEHPAVRCEGRHANFQGWMSLRRMLETGAAGLTIEAMVDGAKRADAALGREVAA